MGLREHRSRWRGSEALAWDAVPVFDISDRVSEGRSFWRRRVHSPSRKIGPRRPRVLVICDRIEVRSICPPVVTPGVAYSPSLLMPSPAGTNGDVRRGSQQEVFDGRSGRFLGLLPDIPLVHVDANGTVQNTTVYDFASASAQE